MPKLYAVVKFPQEENKVAVVPLTWLTEDHSFCFWPPKMRGVRVPQLIRDLVAPSAEWGTYPVTIMARCTALCSSRHVDNEEPQEREGSEEAMRALQPSWQERKESLRKSEALQIGYRCHLQKTSCDVSEAQSFIKRWLPGSGDRCGDRKRRFKEAFVVEQPDDPCCPSGDHRLPAVAGFMPSPCDQGIGSTTIANVPPSAPPAMGLQ
ncbi:hypothetical protein MTO96_025107 [Rhipicephalus appendiculatus]